MVMETYGTKEIIRDIYELLYELEQRINVKMENEQKVVV